MTIDPGNGRHGAPPRDEIPVEVRCREWTQVDRLVAANASRGGLFLPTPEPPAVGTGIRLQVWLPDGKLFSLSGAVIVVITAEQGAATGRPAGCGVRLLATHAADLVTLKQLAAAGSSRPVGAPAPRREDPQPGTPIPVHADRPRVTIRRMKVGRADSITPLPISSAKVVFGLDFGTTYSKISVVHGGKAFVIADEQGRFLIPSIVAYPSGGRTLVGWDARDRVATDPGHTVHSAKRLLGRRITEVEVENHLAQQAYRSSKGPGDQVILDIGSNQVSIPQVAAEVMRHLKRTAERHVGMPVEEIVLTVPVSWDENHRAALRKAADLAGMRTVGMLEEPASAGLAYGFGRERNEIAAVYDFSGGTFDFTIIDISREAFRILASSGDPWLGGDDFDLALATDVANRFWKERKVELQKRLVEWQRLLWACEETKRALSEVDRAMVHLPAAARDAKGPVDLRMEVTRERFEKLCEGLIQRSLSVAQRALDEAGLEPRDIGQIVLTGGSTRIPKVRSAVALFFEREVGTHVNPDEAVVLGAAVHGALVARPR